MMGGADKGPGAQNLGGHNVAWAPGMRPQLTQGSPFGTGLSSCMLLLTAQLLTYTPFCGSEDDLCCLNKEGHSVCQRQPLGPRKLKANRRWVLTTHLSFSSLQNTEQPPAAKCRVDESGTQSCVQSSPWPTSTVQAGGSWGLSTGPMDLLPLQRGDSTDIHALRHTYILILPH